MDGWRAEDGENVGTMCQDGEETVQTVCQEPMVRRPYNPPRPPANTPKRWWRSGVCGVESPLSSGKNLKARLAWTAYDSIEDGSKRVEYRGGEYWVDRLVGREVGAMTFFRGQDGPRMTWEVRKIDRHGSCFDIWLGKRLA